jgi:ArsR family transcriptional regulator
MTPSSDLSGFEKLFQALSDRTRLRLLSLMADGPVSVGYLADQLGESQPKTSRHLAYLRNAGLVSTSREGKWVYYGVDIQSDEGVQIVLDHTLRSITHTQTNAGMASSGAKSSEPAKAVDRTEQPHEDDWKPNEIDVHLL